MSYKVSIKGMENFKCIGGACEHTCCSGWAINLTKADYKKIRNAGIKVKDYTSILGNNSTHYARFKVYADTQNCAFLQNDGLCSLHCKFGHEVLPLVCRVYPRLYKKIGEDYEAGLVLSCPEVVRKFVFSEEEVEFNQTVGKLNTLTTEISLTKHQQLLHDKLKWLGLDILRLEGYFIIEKLYMIEYVYNFIKKNLNDLGLNKAVDCALYSLEEELKKILENAKLIPLNEVFKIIAGLIQNFSISDMLIDIVNVIQQTLTNKGIDLYNTAIQNYFEFEKNNSKIIENILVITFYNYFNICIEGFINFLINYTNILINTLAISALNVPIDEKLITDIVVKLERSIAHDMSKIKYLANYNLKY